MNKPSRNEIERSLQGSKPINPEYKDRSIELPTKNHSSRRQARVLGGNPSGVSHKIPKRNYGWWLVAASLIILSGLAFVIPEFINDKPKIAQEKDNPVDSIYKDSKIPETIEDNPNADPNSGFTVADDRNRVEEYRKTEIKLQKLNKLKANADAAIAQKKYTQPQDNNALQYFQEMLSIDENNIAATDGIRSITNNLLSIGIKNLKADQIDDAKKSLLSLNDIDAESEEYFILSEAIGNYEAAEEKKQRDIKIKGLYAKAELALKKQQLITPKNNNASLFFRQILEIDSENTKAREGIDKISQKYADQTEKNIASRDWIKAENNIKNLRRANNDSALASFLDKKLAEAKKQPKQLVIENNIQKDKLETAQQNPPVNSIQTQPQNSQQRVPNESPIQPAPTKDLSINSETISPKEVFNTGAPVSDPLSNSLNNNQSPTNDVREPNNANPVNSSVNTVTQNQINNQNLNTGLQAYYSGEYVTAFSNLAPLADKNNTRAQIRVGYMYQFGRGVAQNTARGGEYLRKALPDLTNRAESNQSWAQSDLGSLYEDGIVVTQSYPEALSWYRKAAAQNYAGAQTNLGNMYFFGKGVEQSQQEAIKWYRLAAIGGDAIAKQNLIQLGAVNF